MYEYEKTILNEIDAERRMLTALLASAKSEVKALDEKTILNELEEELHMLTALLASAKSEVKALDEKIDTISGADSPLITMYKQGESAKSSSN